MTSDLNTTFGHRPIYIRGEAATFIPNSSFLIPHSSRAFKRNQGGKPPQELPLYLIPQNRSVFSFAHFVSTSSETPM